MATILRTSGIQMGDSILDVSGSAPSYTCRAWVNFDGTGTVAIRASGNVSSITDGGTGIYTVNFTNAMPDVNYSATLVGRRASGSGGQYTLTTLSTTSLLVYTAGNTGTTAIDYDNVCVAIFR